MKTQPLIAVLAFVEPFASAIAMMRFYSGLWNSGVHQDVSLTPADLLAGIVTNGLPSLLGAFDALAVEDRRARRGLAGLGNTHLLPQAMVEFSQKP